MGTRFLFTAFILSVFSTPAWAQPAPGSGPLPGSTWRPATARIAASFRRPRLPRQSRRPLLPALHQARIRSLRRRPP